MWFLLGTVVGSFATWCCVWVLIRSNDLAPGSDKYATLDAAVRAVLLADERID